MSPAHLHPAPASVAIAPPRLEQAAAARPRRAPWLALYAPIPARRELALGAVGWLAFLALWYSVVEVGVEKSVLARVVELSK